MKTTKFFTMAALALMMTACSNDMEDLTTQQPVKGKGIPFTATIEMDDNAITRSLSENGTTLKTSWTEGDEIALVYSVGSTSYNTTATVQFVMDGTAYITATLEDGVVNGTALTIISPASAADGTTGNIKSNLLKTQNGKLSSISESLDVRKGTGIVSVSGSNAVMGSSTKLAAQYAIFKFTLGVAATPEHPLYIKNNSTKEVITTVTPSSKSWDVYVATAPSSDINYKFELISDNNRILKRGKATIEAGKYYQSTLPARYPLDMSDMEKGIDEGCLIANDGKIYMNKSGIPTDKTAEAMVALVGQAADNTYGLGFALDNITDAANSGGHNYSHFYWSKTSKAIETWSTNHPVPGGTWRLPSENDWQMMFSGCQIAGDQVAIGATDYIINGFKQKIDAANVNLPADNYYRTSNGANRYASFNFSGENATATFYGDADIPAYIHACLAF